MVIVMRNNRRIAAWALCAGFLPLVAGCASMLTGISPQEYQTMGAQGASTLDDYALCSGYTWYNTQTLKKEVASRKLDCRQYVSMRQALDKREGRQTGLQSPQRGGARPGVAQSGFASSAAVAGGRTSGPVECGTPRFVNVSADEGKAIQYLFEKRTSIKGVGCISEIVAKDKFPLQGRTLVKYEANVVFPNGYKTECIGIKKDEFTGFGNFMKVSQGCNWMADSFDPLGQPARPGEVRRVAGEDMI
jgi:hypothetical protein